MDMVPAPEVVTCVILVVAYVVYARGAGERPARNVVGAPQVEAKLPAGVAGQSEPPKPFWGSVDDPSHDARVTSVHDDAAEALPVPAGHVVHAEEPATAKVLTPHAMAVVEAAGQ